MMKLNKKALKVKHIICFAAMTSVVGGCATKLYPKDSKLHAQSGEIRIEDTSKTIIENIDANITNISLDENMKYTLQGYCDGENVEYVLQNGKYQNDTCEGTHQYYYRYLVDEQRLESVGFTCDGIVQNHLGQNDLLIEKNQLLGAKLVISAEQMKEGYFDTDYDKGVLEESRKERLTNASFPIVDENNRALCVIEMTPITRGETVYFVGYPHAQDNTGMSISFYDVLKMENRSFSYEKYDINYYSLLSWESDEYQMDSVIDYHEALKIQNYISTNQTLLPPIAEKTFHL